MKISGKVGFSLAVGILLLAAGPAMADVDHPKEGGEWNHGYDAGHVWSNYFHLERCHSSSAEGETFVDSGRTAAGKTSMAEAKVAMFGNKASYKSVC
jgi:opacity protein-like surface antigen